MKITIKSEPYLNCPKPKLTKELMDCAYRALVKCHINFEIDAVETIDIRLCRTLPWFPAHIYITWNGVHHFHFEERKKDMFDTSSRKDNFNHIIALFQ